MKSLQLLAFLIACAVCSGIQPALRADITQDRINQVLNDYINNPMSKPNGTTVAEQIWGRSSWSLAALTQNRSSAEVNQANTYLQSIPTLAPIPVGDPDYFGGAFFQMPLITRLYMKFKDSPLLTQTTRDALEGYMWDYLSRRHVNVDTVPTQRSGWYQFNSENKDTVEKHALLLACEGLIESPDYGPNTTLSNGKTLSEFRDFLQAYYVEYFRQRAREGMTYEVGSPAYLRLTLSSYYNLHDFSRSSALRKMAGDYLTLYWALKVQEYLPNSRMWGGGVIRHEKSYVESASSESYSPMPYVYRWNDVFSRSHPELLNMMTSSYRPPAIVGAIASDANRPQTANQLLGTTGSGYLLTSRIWGRGDDGVNNLKNAIFEPDNSANTRRDTYVHPNYNVGGFTFDLTEGASTYIAGNQQNRSMGIYFNSDRSARIIFHGEGAADDNASYIDINGVVGKNVLVGARALTVRDSGNDTFIYISPGILRTNLVNDSGWIFTKTADTYVGIYIANGSYTEVQSQLGKTMVELTDEWSPVVFQLGAAGEYGNDFEAFKTSLRANAVSYSGGKLTYTSEAGETFEMWANSTNAPKVNGVAVDLNPAKTYESPFLNAYHGLNTMTISYPGYPDLRLDFANYDFPQWDDYQTVALWNMDALNGSGGIADDNGGNVAREASDQRPSRALTLNGATLSASGGGPFGSALNFDGVNDWARASGAWSSAFRTVKIEGWIYPDNNAGANVIVAADGVWKVELNNNSLNFVTWNDSVTPTPLKWPVPLTTNTWHHFVASLDNAGTMQLSANGEPPVVAVVANLRSLNKDIDLGDRPGSNRYFDGLMDDIKISHLNTKAILPRDPMSSLGAFRHAYGLAADGSDDLLDDSNNGVTNILYFLFGLGDPSSPVVPILTSDGGPLLGLPTCEISGGEVIYSYVHRLNHTGPAIRVDSSEDLVSWGDVENVLTALRPSRITTTAVNADYEIRHLHFGPFPPKMFLRCRVDPGN